MPDLSASTKARLPYRLRFRVTESRRSYGFSLEAWGDFVGRGAWTFAQYGAFTNIVYDWKILAEKPLLRESLRSELIRRRVQAGLPAGAGQQSAAHTS